MAAQTAETLLKMLSHVEQTLRKRRELLNNNAENAEKYGEAPTDADKRRTHAEQMLTSAEQMLKLLESAGGRI